MRISDWSSDVCSSDLPRERCQVPVQLAQYVGLSSPGEPLLGALLAGQVRDKRTRQPSHDGIVVLQDLADPALAIIGPGEAHGHLEEVKALVGPILQYADQCPRLRVHWEQRGGGGVALKRPADEIGRAHV